MASTKIKKCLSCQALFNARKDAKTCSATCRKRLQRALQSTAKTKAARLESAIGQELHRLAGSLLSSHVVVEPLVLRDEQGSIQVAEPKAAKGQPGQVFTPMGSRVAPSLSKAESTSSNARQTGVPVTVRTTPELFREASKDTKSTSKIPRSFNSSPRSQYGRGVGSSLTGHESVATPETLAKPPVPGMGGSGNQSPVAANATPDEKPRKSRGFNPRMVHAVLAVAILLFSGGLFAFANHRANEQARQLAEAEQRWQDGREDGQHSASFNNLSAGDLEVTGDTTLNELIAKTADLKNAEIINLLVKGTSTLKGPVTISSQTTLTDLIATGRITLTGNKDDLLLIQTTYNKQGAVSIRNPNGQEVAALGSTGDLYLSGNADIDGVLTVPKATVAKLTTTTTNSTTTNTTNLNVTNAADIDTAAIDSATIGTLDVTGNASIGGTATIGSLGSADTTTVLCYNSSNQIASCSGSGAGSPFVQGGNSFGATATLGTNDNNSLVLETNNTTALTIDTSQDATFVGDITTTGTIEGGTVNATSGIQLGGTNINTGGTLSNVAYLDQGNNFSAANTFSAAGTALSVTNDASVGGDLTVTGSINTATISGGTLSGGNVSGGTLTATAVNSLDVSATAIAVQAAATGLTIDAGTSGTISIGATSTGNVLLAGGSGSTGCTVTNSNGDLTCSGNITGSSSGTVGYWSRSGTTIQPATAGDDITTSGDISTSGSGTITAAGILNANATGKTAIQIADSGAQDSGLTIGGDTNLYRGAANTLTTDDALTVTGLITANGGITSPGSGGNSEQLGSGAVASNLRSTAVGNSASAAGQAGTAVGYAATADALNSTAIGDSSSSGAAGVAVGQGAASGASGTAIGKGTSTGNWGIAIGQNASSTNNYGVAVGYNATAGFFASAFGGNTSAANNYSIALGRSATTTAANQLVIGSDTASIQNAYIGNGVTNASPDDITLHATGGSGTDIAGADLQFAGGQGTGSGAGGDINFQIAEAGGSGSSLNSLATVASLSGTDGSALFQNSTDSTAAFQVQDAGGTELFTIDTSNNQIAIGTSAVPANGALTIGTDTTAATGGLYFGTDTNLYRGAANTLTTDDALTVTGLITANGGIHSPVGASTNEAFGLNALANATGANNTAVGYQASVSNTTGEWNTSVGYQALYDNETGKSNVAIGYRTMRLATGGSYNTAIGERVLEDSTGSFNTALGYNAMREATSGSSNLALGAVSLFNTTSGSYNVGVGGNTLQAVTEGDYNIGLGLEAGDNITTGSRNIIIGYGVDATSATGDDQLNIGDALFGDLSAGQIAIGPAAVPANGVLTVGTNTTTAAGGLYFGTDTNLYRGAANTLKTDDALTVAGLITANGGITSPGSTPTAEQFGNSASATSNFATAVGDSATATGNNTTALGYAAVANHSGDTTLGTGATSGGGNSTTVGYNATSGGTYGTSVGLAANGGSSGVAIGANASAGAFGAVVIGYGATVSPGQSRSIALGYGATVTGANQLVIGSNGNEIQNAYIGGGVTDATPQDITLHATGGSGTDIAGADLQFAGGQGTGSGAGGDINFQIAEAGGSGSSLNSLATVASLSGTDGSALFQNVTDSATAFQIQDSGGTEALIVSTENVSNGYNSADAILKVAEDSGTNRSINAAGSINASGADYAEYIPWDGPKPEPGTVVEYAGSSYVVSSQTTAAFVGNDKFSDGQSILVTFAGQVPVKVSGSVSVGDILVNNGDGTAKGVSPGDATVNDYLGKLGVAQESGSGTVMAAIGTTAASVAISPQSGSSGGSINGGDGDFASINVSGAADIGTLNVTGTATVATLNVTGEATFSGNIILAGNSKIVGNDNTRGEVIVEAGKTSETYEFPSAYTSPPNVVITPTSDPDGNFWVSDITATEFTVHLDAAAAANIKFNFQVQQ